MAKPTTRMPLAGWWVAVCAFWSCAGWALSALHQLNVAGYWTTLVVGLGAASLAWKSWPKKSMHAGDAKSGALSSRLGKWTKRRCRFKRAFPLGFVILAGMAILGGILYGPNNYDGLAYRTPRVLHWLAEGRWHWIHTEFQRLNTRATAFEWMTAPMFALARTDRWEFIVNAVPFLLLPGLVFGVFRRLGIRPRVAWHWMWLLPTGYCYLLQAGGIGNDAFGAFFPLAALYFALRARETGKVSDLWVSVLAAALITASKTSNLPLLLPWAVAVWRVLPLLSNRIAGTAMIAVVAAACSFLPSALLNLSNNAGWNGSRMEMAAFGSGEKWAPMLRFGWNCVLLPVQNLEPPVNPIAARCNHQTANIIPRRLTNILEGHFEPSQAHASLDEMQTEEGAGLGFGVSLLLLAGCLAGNGNASSTLRYPRSPGRLIILSGCIALAVAMTALRWSSLARLVTPYYALVVPCLLVLDSQRRAVGRSWWRMAAIAVFVIAGMVLVVSPARPLWPARTVLSALERRWPQSHTIQRAVTVYSVYRERNDGFAPARATLPPGVHLLGLVTFDDPETSLWRPFGSRRIEHVVSTDTPGQLRKKGIEYVLLNPKKLQRVFEKPFEQWLSEMGGRVVEVIPMRLRAGEETTAWYLVQLSNASASSLR